MDRFVGIDGCRAGWFTASLFDDPSWEPGVFPNIVDIWNRQPHAKLVLIDIPIELRDKGAEERICDAASRKLLDQPRSASVFPPLPGKPGGFCQTPRPHACAWGGEIRSNENPAE